MRIAMWSGPRNLSTAMMYAFAQRGDCAGVDEPFYAAYLAATGADHPMRDEIIATGETDPDRVAAACAGAVPRDRAVFYQKHMVHHMISGFPRDWMAGLSHVFLIRHPARVVASYAAKRQDPAYEDLGFDQQSELYADLKSAGHSPLVVDSAKIRADPEGQLRSLCAGLGLSFDPEMLHWPERGREEDGVWAKHWYPAVHRSRGFSGPEGPMPELTGTCADLAERAMPAYQAMREKALT